MAKVIAPPEQRDRVAYRIAEGKGDWICHIS